MTEQDKIPEWIDRFNNNELSGEELAQFIELLNKDPELRSEVTLDKELNEILSANDLLELRKKIIRIREREQRKGGGRRILLIAASILILISLPILFFIFKNRDVDHQQAKLNDTARSLRNQMDSAKKVNPVNKEGLQLLSDKVLHGENKTISTHPAETLLASNYSPFPAYENLVGAHFRSGDFRLILPASKSRFHLSDPLVFKWESGNQHQLKLTIMDNKGNPVYEADHLAGNSLKLPKGYIKKGLFYFKFLIENEMVVFGKFIVE